MAITEFVLPTFKQDIESITAFAKIIAPFLSNLVDNHTTPPKLKHFGKVVSEDGKDVTGDFRPCLGIEWEQASDFTSLLTTSGFGTFKSMVQPYATAPPNPQLYETDFGPREVLARALTEVWQVKVGDETDAEEKVEKARKVWGVFVDAVGKGTRIQGTSLNQEERLWIGVLGWESSEIRETVLGSPVVREAKKSLDALVWKTFVASFAQ
ncbi:hypothetical protein IFR04_010124 [Cadophora malorum]|uniref:Uncharacterized protein n=1 Tax=Cadophora malorum TaxID=108018 RepID=A0A8H7TBS0_9HELO|nr:hypothetical protein IFR04_010124 [Cadophora malorum]